MDKIMMEIKEIVNRETKAWNTQNVDLLLSVFHPDMVWPWPSKNIDHDPIKWEIYLGKYNYERWKKIYVQFFSKYKLVHNKREIKKIVLSREKDGAFAVVDIDTLWIDKKSGDKNHWKGRTCKVYSKVGNEWKMTMHTGVLQY